MSDTRLFLRYAGCRDTPMTQFFPSLPIGDERDALAAWTLARCADHCPVQSACASDALRRKATHGLVGGVDLGPGPNPRPDAVTELHRIASRVISY
ncbi:WhiB family transcriptional regulator [Nocardia sp. CC201C]|uniref:WhiB family transcriptional regulator n=1 Tax=Nocardia sp. CC201C TaxID=3044575 RepID=UPI0024A7E14B|nr:WhiB family transcriptional regulator [Nocardia sp. CC201C]